jgi:hypothetical protein
LSLLRARGAPEVPFGSGLVNPPEIAAGREPGLAAYRSLAKHSGVSIDTALARNDTLKALLETRGGIAELRVRDILLGG